MTTQEIIQRQIEEWAQRLEHAKTDEQARWCNLMIIALKEKNRDVRTSKK